MSRLTTQLRRYITSLDSESPHTNVNSSRRVPRLLVESSTSYLMFYWDQFVSAEACGYSGLMGRSRNVGGFSLGDASGLTGAL
jgi:hypothetical protein